MQKNFSSQNTFQAKKKLPKYHLQVSGVISVLKMSFVFFAHFWVWDIKTNLNFLNNWKVFCIVLFLMTYNLQVSSSQHESDYCSVSRGLQVYALVPWAQWGRAIIYFSHSSSDFMRALCTLGSGVNCSGLPPNPQHQSQHTVSMSTLMRHQKASTIRGLMFTPWNLWNFQKSWRTQAIHTSVPWRNIACDPLTCNS